MFVSKRWKTTLGAVLALGQLGTAPAQAADPVGVQTTLEGCRKDANFTFPDQVGFTYPVELWVTNYLGCADSVVKLVEVKDEFLIYVPDASRALAEAARVLVPGGRALVIDAKVSLNSYQDAYGADSEEERSPLERRAQAFTRGFLRRRLLRLRHLPPRPRPIPHRQPAPRAPPSLLLSLLLSWVVA